MLAPTKTIAVYIRVSTVGQNEAGQREAITQWLSAHGHDPSSATWYVDKQSGSTTARPGLQQMHEALFAGHHHTVVVWRLDRLARNLRDGINLLADWCDAGLRVVAIMQQLDFGGTLGKTLAAVLLGVAQMELEAIKERQAAGIAAARQRGVYSGRRPGTLKGKPQRALELRDKGLSRNEIATAMGVSVRTVTRYLANVR